MLDDAHPRRAMRPNGLSRRLIEDLCAGFTALCAADIAAAAPAMDMAARLTPGVRVRDPAPYRADPRRALADCSAAESILGWRPCFS